MFLLATSCLEAGSLYSIQSLGSLGASAGTVSAISNSGVTVGFVTNSGGEQVPVSFANGQSNPLTGYGQANGVNAAGTVVGTSFLNGTPSVTEWSNGQATTLAANGGPINGYGVAINNAGQVAGGYNEANGVLHAFVWSKGKMVDLGTLGGTWGSANSINSAGQMAGTSTTKTGTFNAFFSNGTGMTDIGTLGGSSSYGMAINNPGEIVGSAAIANGSMNAFSWNGSKMKDLGTLGGLQSYAYGVNNGGTVVGSSWMPGNLVMHGFVDTDGVMLDLNQLLPVNSGWTIDAAYGINDAGDIVATAMFDGQSYAVELMPSCMPTATPEPYTVGLAGLGMLALGMLRRARMKPRASF